MTLRERLVAWWRRRRRDNQCLDFSGNGQVRVKDLRYYLNSPKVKRQVEAARALRDGLG